MVFFVLCGAWLLIKIGQALFLSLLLFFQTASAAQISLCGTIEQVQQWLADNGENPVAQWQEPEGGLRVLFAAPDGATWTLVATSGDRACTMRDGVQVEVWQTVPPPQE
jgi:hypothetical protein